MKEEILKIHGRHACRAMFEKRREDIQRVFVDESASKAFGDLLSYCASQRLPYKVVDAEELARFSGARHHEGICIASRVPEPTPLGELVAAPGPCVLLALEGVKNPHNVGTLVRSAAHFGARAALLGGLSRVSAASYRTAEGAAEHLELYCAPSLEGVLDTCKGAGFLVVATSSHEGESVYDSPLPERCVLLLGAEGPGLSAGALAAADLRRSIPGTELVESLNVAASAAVLLSEHWRCYSGSSSSG